MASERAAIVTAAGGGIGAAVARELAAAGFRLALMSRSQAVDTLAKVITVTTYWRCRECDKTWTIASQAAAPRRT